MTSARGSIGVVIPTYNRPELVAGAVRSALGQSRPPTAIVVVDDGSPVAISEDSLGTLPHGIVRLLRTPNGGVSAARNAGAMLLNTDYILFLDDDDTLYPEALAGLAAALDENPTATASSGGGRRRFGTETPRATEWPCTTVLHFDDLMRRNHLFIGATLVRRVDFVAIGGFEVVVPLAEDWDLWLRLARRGPMVPAATCAVEYFVHTGNASRTSKVAKMAITLVASYWKQFTPTERQEYGPALASYLVEQYASDLYWYARGALRKGQLRTATSDTIALLWLGKFAIRFQAGRRCLLQVAGKAEASNGLSATLRS